MNVAGKHRLDAFADAGDLASDVRAALSWSYVRLEPDAALAFRLAGLHPAPRLDRFAVAALTGTAADQAGRQLDALASAFLMQRVDEDRYEMHDLLRSYAAELAADLETAQARQAALARLLDFYLQASALAMDLAYPAERRRRPKLAPSASELPAFAGEADALAWLDAERATLVAIAVYAAEQSWPSHAIRFSDMLHRYLDTAAQFPDSIAVHDGALRAARACGDSAAEAMALLNLGGVELRQGRYQSGTSYYSQALPLLRQEGNQPGEARALANLGLVRLLQGNPEQAVDFLNRSLTLYSTLGDRVGEARALGNLGFAALRQGRYSQAADYLRRSLDLSRQAGDKGGEARALTNLGEIELNRGNYRQAADNFGAVLRLWRQLGDRTSQADTLASLGLAELRQERYAEAADYLRQALALCRKTGDIARQALAHNGLGEVHSRRRLADGRARAACRRAQLGRPGRGEIRAGPCSRRTGQRLRRQRRRSAGPPSLARSPDQVLRPWRSAGRTGQGTAQCGARRRGSHPIRDRQAHRPASMIRRITGRSCLRRATTSKPCRANVEAIPV